MTHHTYASKRPSCCFIYYYMYIICTCLQTCIPFHLYMYSFHQNDTEIYRNQNGIYVQVCRFFIYISISVWSIVWLTRENILLKPQSSVFQAKIFKTSGRILCATKIKMVITDIYQDLTAFYRKRGNYSAGILMFCRNKYINFTSTFQTMH